MSTQVLYTETLSNPTLAVADIPALADIAHAVRAKLVVDNTFAPCIVSPARWGADVVVHSLTKYINGASDIIAGTAVFTYVPGGVFLWVATTGQHKFFLQENWTDFLNRRGRRPTHVVAVCS
jgi:O-acetylhomoserine/O-acetylserine sulfhydrylase-like pyridoxal-dependent enzyme